MKEVYILSKNELLNFSKEISILTIVLLPMLMSKLIFLTSKDESGDVFLLGMWLIFAQVMVGIMLTGTNLTQEREAKTLDALLCTPLTFEKILLSKGLTIMSLSLISQLMVYIINFGFNSELLFLIIPMFMGGLIFILIGSIIGLRAKTPQTGTAVSTVVMISMFLIVTVYSVLPMWGQKIATFIPSISISVIIKNLMLNKELYITNWIVIICWIVICIFIISKIIKKWNK